MGLGHERVVAHVLDIADDVPGRRRLQVSSFKTLLYCFLLFMAGWAVVIFDSCTARDVCAGPTQFHLKFGHPQHITNLHTASTLPTD
jgi:hypothetical protein